MSIDTAVFAVQRGDTQYKCLGSDLSSKVIADDLFVVQRGSTLSKGNSSEVADTDLLVCTDTDGVTYSVTGAQFKGLFGPPEYETDPNIDLVPGEKTYTLRAPLDGSNKLLSIYSQYNYPALKFEGFEDDSFYYIPIWQGSQITGTGTVIPNPNPLVPKMCYFGMVYRDDDDDNFRTTGWFSQGQWFEASCQTYDYKESSTMMNAKPTWFITATQASTWMTTCTELTMLEPAFFKIKKEDLILTQSGGLSDGDPIAGTDWETATDGQLLAWVKDEVTKYYLIDNQTAVQLKVTPKDYGHYDSSMDGNYVFAEWDQAKAEILRCPSVSAHDDWSYTADFK